MDVCYELNVPKSLQTQGIQSIEVTRSFDYFGGDQETAYIKVSPPGYLHQNIDVRSRVMQSSMDAYFELEYQIDNVLKIGDEDCHPDPSFDRDECVIKQLLNVKINHYHHYALNKVCIFRNQSNSTDAYHLLWVIMD